MSDTQITDDIEHLIARIAESVAPSVVRIGRDHRGSGLVIDGGTVLTNAHNLRDMTTTVWFADGHSVEASVRATDPDGDLVVLDAETGDAPPVTWGTTPARLGQQVLAVGVDPGSGPRATIGRISATQRTFRGPRRRRIEGAIEHTAPVRRGGSGGPVADADGQVIGISTHRTRGGLYLALPTDDRLRSRLDKLTSGQDIDRPRLGVALAPAEVARRLRRAVGLPDLDGLLVRGVESDSPAAAAGLQEGDLIVSAAGTPLATPDDLFAALDGAEASIVLNVVRGADSIDLAVDLTT